ncbi:hypothetical protein NO2_1574 [Candidatus Termititenax persephonae]|uniref:Uncharacterized protein n=1 Tax=Candidatus Termititenax persephonae TaxID=2218525 RepID=A0A388TIQ8_9BACT|nr:hypothetical protein NO2_1574 [Candidatus Termititenax persephonae]
MQTYLEALREYCEEYNNNRESEHTDRLREIYWLARHSRPEAVFSERNIVALATRLTKVLDFRQESGKEFIRKRPLAA